MNVIKIDIRKWLFETAHLSLTEDGAYFRLLCRYYEAEAPIAADLAEAQRIVRAATKSERAAVKTVLNEFFTLQEDGWHHARADRDIAAWQARAWIPGSLKPADRRSVRIARWCAIRRQILARDGHVCRYCGSVDAPFEIDHIVPRSMGGGDEASNLAVACRPCNRLKSNLPLDRFLAKRLNA